MKTYEEIMRGSRVMTMRKAEDGFCGHVFLASSKKPAPAVFVASWGGGWDHVSVSFANRCPTWDEMAEVKRLFFRPEEVAVQYHPAESEYVNNFPYALHIWRDQRGEMPTPPAWMVGIKHGQNAAQVYEEARRTLEAQDYQRMRQHIRREEAARNG